VRAAHRRHGRPWAPFRRQRSRLRAERLPTHAVILTKVRTQCQAARRSRSWVLTFVRMTGRRGLRHARQGSSFPRRREPRLAGLAPTSPTPEDMDPRLRGDDDALRDAPRLHDGDDADGSARPILPPLQGRVGVGHVHASAPSVARSVQPKQAASQSASKTCFPAKAGTQTGLPPSRENKEAGAKTRTRKSACEGTRAPVRPDNLPRRPEEQRNAQTPLRPLVDVQIRCPTRASERTLSGCPTPPIPHASPRPETPLSAPISGDVQNAVRL